MERRLFLDERGALPLGRRPQELHLPRVGQFRQLRQRVGVGHFAAAVLDDAGCSHDGPVGMRAVGQANGLAGLELAFAENAEIPTGATRLVDEGGEVFHLPAAGDLPAGLTGLRDLDDDVGADLEGVANADGGFVETGDSEVFSECAVWELEIEFGLPELVVGGTVGEGGFVGSAVCGGIALPVAFDVEAGEPDGSVDRFFDDGGGPGTGAEFGPAFVGHFAGLADLYGEEGGIAHGGNVIGSSPATRPGVQRDVRPPCDGRGAIC